MKTNKIVKLLSLIILTIITLNFTGCVTSVTNTDSSGNKHRRLSIMDPLANCASDNGGNVRIQQGVSIGGVGQIQTTGRMIFVPEGQSPPPGFVPVGSQTQTKTWSPTEMSDTTIRR